MMQSSNQHVISTCAKWLHEDKPLWLCTILKTWGSSPRPVGSLMACTADGKTGQDGKIVGSISGGCIEEDLLEQLQDGTLISRYEIEKRPFVIKYGITADEVERFQLPCGGQLHVLLEYIAPNSEHKKSFAQLDSAIKKHQAVARQLNLETGEIKVTDHADKLSPLKIEHNLLTQVLAPQFKLLLIGAGEVARYVAQMALALEFDITLCDPRERYLNNWQVDGVKTTKAMPDDVVRKDFSHKYAAIIALAHDPRVDDMALMEALKTDAFYVGAMGSIKTSEKRRERLPELGLSPQEISKLHAPIGYQIGSKTPAEIAISILAELTAAKNQLQATNKQTNNELSTSSLKVVSQQQQASQIKW